MRSVLDADENGSVSVLIERQPDLAILRGLVDAAAAGRGGTVFIEGEAGIGKTELSLLGSAARDVGADGPAGLGVRALRGGLGAPRGPGSRADEVVHAFW